EARGEQFPRGRGHVHPRLGLADQVIDQVVGVYRVLALDEVEDTALVVVDVEPGELAMDAVDRALEAFATVGQATVAGVLGDPGGHVGVAACAWFRVRHRDSGRVRAGKAAGRHGAGVDLAHGSAPGACARPLSLDSRRAWSHRVGTRRRSARYALR